jgi:hypothetical protein
MNWTKLANAGSGPDWYKHAKEAFLSIQCEQFADYLWDRLSFMQLDHKLLKHIWVFLRLIRRPTNVHLSKSYHCYAHSQNCEKRL